MIPFSIFPMRDVIMVSIQEEIDDRHVSRLVKELSNRVKSSHVRYVIIDLHDVEAVDTFLAGEIEKLAAMLYFLRASTIVVGLSVPVVLTLLDFGIKFQGVEFALDVEQALSRIGGPQPFEEDLPPSSEDSNEEEISPGPHRDPQV